MEFWLYVDEPALIWKSWRGLLSANARLLLLLLPPIAILAVPTTALFFYLDATFGHRPLPPGASALVTVQLNAATARIHLQAPSGIAIEGRPVHIPSARQITWRIRPVTAVSGALQVSLDGAIFSKSLEAGEGIRRLSLRRVRSLPDLILFPTETPLPPGPLDWIEVAYPESDQQNWLWGLLAFFTLGTVLRKKTKVT
jgi:hypothetical protein